MIKMTPTMRTADARDGGSMKFDGMPFGCNAIGVFEGSLLGGGDPIAGELQVNGRRYLQWIEDRMGKYQFLAQPLDGDPALIKTGFHAFMLQTQLQLIVPHHQKSIATRGRVLLLLVTVWHSEQRTKFLVRCGSITNKA